jgi:hypothetical protein
MANIQKRPDGRWRARYRDEAGQEHAKHFARKVEAQRWLDEVTTSIVTGQYVDPRAGKITFQAYAEQWRAAQVHRPTSAAYVEGMLRRHVYPIYGARAIGSILPSEIQAWVKLLGVGDRATKRKPLAAGTIGVLHGSCRGSSARRCGTAGSWRTRARAPGCRESNGGGSSRSRPPRSKPCAQSCPMSSRRSSPSPPAPACAKARSSA